MAFNKKELGSWGDVFIHSLYKEYDPWFMWHKLLYLISLISEKQNVHIIVNGFVYGALSSWFFIVFNRYSQFNKYLIIFFSLFLPIMCLRYFSLRPDILSGLFLLYFMLIKRKSLMVLISLLYIPFYYVFWFYFGYLGILKLFLKKYKDFIVLFILGLIGLIFHLSYDFNGYIDITKNILNNDYLLQGHSVGESRPFLIPLAIKNSLGSNFILIFLLILSYLIYNVFKPNDRIIELVILFMPLIFLQLRFFALLYPLILVLILNLLYKFYLLVYEHNLSYAIDYVINLIKEKSYFGNINKKWLKIISISFIVLLILFSFTDKIISYKKYQHEINNLNFIIENEFKNKRILYTAMDTSLYVSIYKNPTSKYIPSCSLGWIDYKEENYRNTYFNLLTNSENITQKEFFEFVNFNNIDIIIISKFSSSLVINNKNIIKNGYKFHKLYKNYLIFIKK